MRETTQATQGSADGLRDQGLLPGLSLAKALFLLAAGLSFVLSVYLYFSGSR